jgi:hypothetical protein
MDMQWTCNGEKIKKNGNAKKRMNVSATKNDKGEKKWKCREKEIIN